MVLTQPFPVNQITLGVAGSRHFHFGFNVWLVSAAAAPTDGTSGDGAGWAGPGSMYIDRTASTGAVYRNSGTKSSPVWTAM